MCSSFKKRSCKVKHIVASDRERERVSSSVCVCVLVGVGSLSRARKTHLYGHTFALKYQLKPIVVFSTEPGPCRN